MQDRRRHQLEVQDFLKRQFNDKFWEFALPQGTGNETYIAHSPEHIYFIKLGVQAAKYQAMTSIGLTPQIIAVGSLSDGTSIIVQPYINGRTPSWRDYQIHLEQFATAIHKMHHSPEVRQVLPNASSDLYCSAGLIALDALQQKWDLYKAQVLETEDFIDASLNDLGRQINTFEGTGLVASHNDICNANWLITSEGKLYLIDLESMSWDDPAVDIGATLWWYYPPELRKRFLFVVGHANDEEFINRMHVRMAIHCLNIMLPREESFEKFDATAFLDSLTDFRAILAGRENPHGYDD